MEENLSLEDTVTPNISSIGPRGAGVNLDAMVDFGQSLILRRLDHYSPWRNNATGPQIPPVVVNDRIMASPTPPLPIYKIIQRPLVNNGRCRAEFNTFANISMLNSFSNPTYGGTASNCNWVEWDYPVPANRFSSSGSETADSYALLQVNSFTGTEFYITDCYEKSANFTTDGLFYQDAVDDLSAMSTLRFLEWVAPNANAFGPQYETTLAQRNTLPRAVKLDQRSGSASTGSGNGLIRFPLRNYYSDATNRQIAIDNYPYHWMGAANVRLVINSPAANFDADYTAPTSPAGFWTLTITPKTGASTAAQTRDLFYRAAAEPWKPTTFYPVGVYCYNGANVYRSIQEGASAGSGGPTGTGSSINDGSVIWEYVQAKHGHDRARQLNSMLNKGGDGNTVIVGGDGSGTVTPGTVDFTGGVDAQTGMPIEICVALCNATGSNLWYTLPVCAAEDLVTFTAEYIRDNLDPALLAIFELGNEPWNYIFGITHIRIVQSVVNGRTGTELQMIDAEQLARSAACAEVIKDILADRCCILFNTQKAIPERAQYVSGLPDFVNLHDQFAITWYMSCDIVSLDESYHLTYDPALGVSSATIPNAMAKTLNGTKAVAVFATAAGKSGYPWGYEGGHHQEAPHTTDGLAYAKSLLRDPRLGVLYGIMLDELSRLDPDGVWCHFTYAGRIGFVGNVVSGGSAATGWGAREYEGQLAVDAPRWDALTKFQSGARQPYVPFVEQGFSSDPTDLPFVGYDRHWTLPSIRNATSAERRLYRGDTLVSSASISATGGGTFTYTQVAADHGEILKVSVFFERSGYDDQEVFSTDTLVTAIADDYVVLTPASISPYVVPAGKKIVEVHCVGAGGRGAQGTSGTYGPGGGGGAGAGASTNISAGTSCPFQIGTGSNSLHTKLGVSITTTCQAARGSNANSTSGSGGQGGQVANCTGNLYKNAGGSGGSVSAAFFNCGGGGGAGGPNGAGASGGNAYSGNDTGGGGGGGANGGSVGQPGTNISGGNGGAARDLTPGGAGASNTVEPGNGANGSGGGGNKKSGVPNGKSGLGGNGSNDRVWFVQTLGAYKGPGSGGGAGVRNSSGLSGTPGIGGGSGGHGSSTAVYGGDGIIVLKLANM